MLRVASSARRSAVLAELVCLAPLPILLLTSGFGEPVRVVCASVGAAACAVPLFFRTREAFRTACVCAGVTASIASVPPLVAGVLAELGYRGWVLLLTFLFLPVAAVPALVAAVREARGPVYGRGVAVLGRSVGIASVVCWGLLTIFTAPWWL
ncbi:MULTISPECIES: hypothetical protein [unclassified Kitasatospora]|uniref:hypothetical protein n=1 Tax=unclassified Kitasatospora TaxID=2633591 RepID=UPI003402956D